MTTFGTPVKQPTFQRLSARRRAVDRAATVLVVLAVLVALIPLVWVLATVVVKGIPAVTSSGWFSHSLSGLGAEDAGGGVYHAIVGTLLQGGLTALISIPIGIFVAIYLIEYAGGGSLGKVTTFMVDILSGVPSIVAGLFIYALWIAILGFTMSAFAAALALILLMIPVVVRATGEMLKIVPQELREASYALGVPKWKTIVRIVIPTALSGIITGVMLALARILGETAPLLILVGYAPFINTNMFAGEMGSLPMVMVTQRAQDTIPATDRIWGSALTLILIIAVLNVIAKVIGHFSSVRSR
jgi:phosphate transport system permease protein